MRTIRPMHFLRHAPQLARFVLAWFVLSLGVAVASPLVGPQDQMLVCSGAGTMKLMPQGDDGGDTDRGAPMACPLCACVAPPPAAPSSAPPHALSYALQGVAAARLAARTAAPLPARGPPSLL